jgi:hypothetical protein
MGTTAEGSRSSTPGHKMLRSANAGRTVSMPRLETLSKPRVLVTPHASPPNHAPPRNAAGKRAPGLPHGGGRRSPSKSVSMVHLNGPGSARRQSDDAIQDGSGRPVKIRAAQNRSGKCGARALSACGVRRR